MLARRLAVEGALEFTPRVFPDARGRFLSPFQEKAFTEAHGAPLFRVAQTNHSVSRRGVVRGIHFTATPPGTAKYVYCARGAALDIVVDIRAGSPTFGRWDAVLMDQVDHRALYFPVGTGHAFVALQDDTVMAYMLSDGYVPENELSLSVLDPSLALPVTGHGEPVLSDRDRAAVTLAQAHRQGLLPQYARCREIERSHAHPTGKATTMSTHTTAQPLPVPEAVGELYDRLTLNAMRDGSFNPNVHIGYWDTPDSGASLDEAMDRLTDVFTERLGVHDASHVLDLGCGVGGPGLRVAAQTGARVTGISISAEQIRTADRLAAEAGLGDRVVFRHGDAMQLPFGDASFDAVMALESLCHMPDRQQVLTEVCRVLVPGGRLVLTDVFERAPRKDVRHPGIDRFCRGLMATMADIDEYVALLHRSGLRLREMVDVTEQTTLRLGRELTGAGAKPGTGRGTETGAGARTGDWTGVTGDGTGAGAAGDGAGAGSETAGAGSRPAALDEANFGFSGDASDPDSFHPSDLAGVDDFGCLLVTAERP